MAAGFGIRTPGRHHTSRAKKGRASRRGYFQKPPSQAVLSPCGAQNAPT
jgi:hypothetical protein